MLKNRCSLNSIKEQRAFDAIVEFDDADIVGLIDEGIAAELVNEVWRELLNDDWKTGARDGGRGSNDDACDNEAVEEANVGDNLDNRRSDGDKLRGNKPTFTSPSKRPIAKSQNPQFICKSSIWIDDIIKLVKFHF